MLVGPFEVQVGGELQALGVSNYVSIGSDLGKGPLTSRAPTTPDHEDPESNQTSMVSRP